MPRTVAIGVQDFSKLIENNSFYVDKTNFIKEWWENRDDITLITRPRRFGKTLTMSMIDYFFSIRHAGRSDLFEGLKIWKDQDYRNLQGTYPVIFLSFANLKAAHYEELCQDVRGFAAREYRRHAYLLKSDSFLPTDQEHFYKRLSGEGSINDICSSINLLSEYLYEYYGKKLIILLDEYTSNRESGFGRYDVLLEPRERKHDAIIMEFKVIDPGVEKSLKDTVQAALRQIMDKKYAAALESKCGRDRIRIYGFAFRGKEVLIDGGYLYAYD